MTWAVDVIQDHLRFLGEFEKDYGPATALLEIGSEFGVAGQVPKWLKPGRSKECYKNAAQAALQRDDVFYAEGYAIDIVNVPVPIEHAWLVTADGQVLDPTWHNAREYVYYGVVFKRATLETALVSTQGDAGILSDHVLARTLCSSSERFRELLVPYGSMAKM